MVEGGERFIETMDSPMTTSSAEASYSTGSSKYGGSRKRGLASGAASAQQGSAGGLVTSLMVFRQFIHTSPSDGALDASKILTPECYHAWLKARGAQPSAHGLKMFRRALSAHVTGTDGRTPFNQEEEKAILRCLRKRRPWRHLIQTGPEQETNGSKAGQMAFRSRGFHERRLAGEMPEFAAKKRAKTLPVTNPVMPGEDDRSSGQGDDSDDGEEDDEENASQSGSSNSDAMSTRVSERSAAMSSETELPPHHQTGLVPFSAATYYAEAALAAPPSSSSSMFNVCTAGVSALVYSLAQLTTRFMQQVGDGWWAKVHEAGRMAILSLGFIGTPDMAEAKRVMDELTAEFPDEYVIIMDHQSKDFRKKYMCVNELGVQYYGEISRETGGTERKRYHPDELLQMYRVFIAAYIKRGEWVPFKLRHRCVDGKFRWFSSVVRADFDRHFLVEKGKLLDPNPVD